MKVGQNDAQELKQLALQKEIPFANLLRGYVLEDLLFRVYQSEYQEYFWLRNDRMLGEEAYRRGGEDKLVFYYHESSRHLSPDKLVPGQRLSKPLLEVLIEEVLQRENSNAIQWKGEVQEQPGVFIMELGAVYKEMSVPVTLELRTVSMENQRPDKRKLDIMLGSKHALTYLVYSAENQLGTDLFQMMDKLELIGDMGAYYRVYQILKTQPLSGRHLMEELTELSAHTPQIKKERRLEQLKGYRSYSYMRKRWEQYIKRHDNTKVTWEEALDLILALVEPLWTAFCRDEIFFDDWMPELGRLF